jgi:transcriptional regulator with XRE-family HTH domain
VEEGALYRWLGGKIRSLRQDRGLTQADLAVAVGITRASLANIEAGRQRSLVHTLVALAKGLQCDVCELLPETARGPAATNWFTASTPEHEAFVTAVLKKAQKSRG